MPKVFFGATNYVSAVAPVPAIAIGSKSLIFRKVTNTDHVKFAAGLILGCISGVASTPFEMIAQAKTLWSFMNKAQILRQSISTNGLTAPMRGAGILGTRESMWFTACTQMPDLLGPHFQSFGLNRNQA